MNNRLKLNFNATDNSDGVNPNNSAARLLCYGAAGTRKTWFMGTAAKNFRLTILDGDGDDGTGILRNIPEEYHQNITVIQLAMHPNPALFALFLTTLAKERTFIWDVERARVIKVSGWRNLDDTKNYYMVDMSKLGPYDVLGIDSWTGLVQAMTSSYVELRDVDVMSETIGKTTKSGARDKIDYYGYAQQVLDYTLDLIKTIPCHVITTGHEAYAERETISNGVVMTKPKVQIQSSSANHGAKISSRFGDTFYFTATSNKLVSNVDTSSSPLQEGKGRRVAPAIHTFPGWDFTDYAKEAMLRLPPPDVDLSVNEFIQLLTGAEIKTLANAASQSAGVISA